MKVIIIIIMKLIIIVEGIMHMVCSLSFFLLFYLSLNVWCHVNAIEENDDLGRPSAANCTWVYITQPLSHSARGHSAGSYEQRLCVYSDYWQPQQGLPIFLYTGNESPVEEYVNNTGLMWTLAKEFQALVIFAEHRYFGSSVPDIWRMEDCASYLSADDALADYASIANRVRRASSAGVMQWWDGLWGESHLNESDTDWILNSQSDGDTSPESAIIAFGGSYGGMLASWLRIQYPSAIDGAIAASAPIWGFPLTSCPLDSSAQVVTYATSPSAGASARCADNLKAAYVLIADISKTAEGRSALTDAMNLCTPLKSSYDSMMLLDYLQIPLFDLAEGSYPFPSDYITFALTDSTAPLPPWPLQVMCEDLADDFGIEISGNTVDVEFSVSARKSDTYKRSKSSNIRRRTLNEDALVDVKVNWAETTNNGYNIDDLRSTRVLELASSVGQSIQVWYNVTGTLPECIDWEQGAAPNEDATDKSDFTQVMASLKNPKKRSRPLRSPALSGRKDDIEDNYKSRYDWKDTNSDSLNERDYRKFKNYLDDDYSDNACNWKKEEFDSGTAWNVLVCNEGVNLVNWWAQGVGNDLYWPPNQERNYSLESLIGDSLEYCAYYSQPEVGLYGLPAQPDNWAFWIDTAFGGNRLQYATNIVFSNGNLDPWSPAGVDDTTIQLDDSVVVATIDMGGHHLDLFWPTDEDPQSVKDVRAMEAANIARWIAEKQSV